MFTLLTDTLTLIISTLLPTFLTYKALAQPTSVQTSTSLHPWLTYWTINGLLLSFPRILPFDSYIRLGLHIYLLVPGRAEALYQGYLAPWLREHESSIEEVIAKVHENVRGYAGELVGRVQEALVGAGRKTQLRQEQEEEQRRRKQREASAGGYIGSLLARWSSEAMAQEQKQKHAVPSGDGGQQTLATRLGQMANAAAVIGVGRLEEVVGDAAGKGSPTQGSAESSAGLAPSSAAAQTAGGDADLMKSRSELDFEKIEQDDAPTSEAKAAKEKASWSSWLWSDKLKSSPSPKAAKTE